MGSLRVLDWHVWQDKETRAAAQSLTAEAYTHTPYTRLNFTASTASFSPHASPHHSYSLNYIAILCLILECAVIGAWGLAECVLPLDGIVYYYYFNQHWVGWLYWFSACYSKGKIKWLWLTSPILVGFFICFSPAICLHYSTFQFLDWIKLWWI